MKLLFWKREFNQEAFDKRLKTMNTVANYITRDDYLHTYTLSLAGWLAGCGGDRGGY